ncbi:MAG: hypothetical protein KIG50_06480 [Lachnospiraceae bacterium]|nr:hypothetical protein [Lachnospiraceae bacterium]
MERRDLLQFSIDNVLEIILIFDGTGTIIYANRTSEQQLEYKNSLCGCKITEVFPGEFTIEKNVLRLQYKADGTIHNMMAYRGNRTCFPTDVKLLAYETAGALSFGKGNDYGEPAVESGEQIYICTGYDTSAKVLLEKKASQADLEAENALKVKSEFVANVTHELRTPVNGILGNTQELLNRETEPDKRKLLHLVERGCRDMNAIINNILDFSKLEAGKFVLEPRKFHFRSMMDYVKENHAGRIVEKGLDFSVTISQDVPEYIVSDELRIVQILNNLISNAYKFTAVGEIHVEVVKTAQAGNRVELFFMVIDSGIGIAKTEQDKLFKSFSQVDASISRKYGGTGLGLNICKQLVELMDGGIHVESEAGKGSLFSFDIWAGLPEDCEEYNKEEQEDNNQSRMLTADEQILRGKLQSLTENRVSEKIWKFGEEENKKEIEKKMSKLILCVEMENWEKAEMFAETVKQLLAEAPGEVKSAALRMKMAVQKGDYEKTTKAFEVLQKLL